MSIVAAILARGMQQRARFTVPFSHRAWRRNIMTKAELVRTIAGTAGITDTLAHQVLDAIEAAAVKTLKKEGEFTLPGFGKLKLTKTKARKGRNPKTGEAIQIPAGKRVKLAVSKTFKDQVT